MTSPLTRSPVCPRPRSPRLSTLSQLAAKLPAASLGTKIAATSDWVNEAGLVHLRRRRTTITHEPEEQHPMRPHHLPATPFGQVRITESASFEAGYPERFVSEQVGHSASSTTAIYTSVSDDFKNQILARALAGAFPIGGTR